MAVSLRKSYATPTMLAELDAIAAGADAASVAVRAGRHGDARRIARRTRSRIQALATFGHPAVARAAYIVAAARP